MKTTIDIELLKRIDSLLVNLANEGRPVKHVRNQVYKLIYKTKMSLKDDCIIITTSETQVQDLHVACRGEFNNTGFWGQKTMNYNQNWHWEWKAGKLSGTAGHDSLKGQINNNPDLPVIEFSDLQFYNESGTVIYQQSKK